MAEKDLMSDGRYREFTHEGVRYQCYGPGRWKSGLLPHDMKWIDVALVPPELWGAEAGPRLLNKEESDG